MQPLAQEAAQVLIVRAMAQPLLRDPPFLYGFPKQPLLLLGETDMRSSYSDRSPLILMLNFFFFKFNSGTKRQGVLPGF